MKACAVLVSLLIMLGAELLVKTPSKDALVPEVYINEGAESLVKKQGMVQLDGLNYTGNLVAVNTLDQITRYTPYLNGLRQGASRGLYPDSSLAFERFYNLGKSDGVHRGWYPNGILKFEYNFKDGVFHGSVREWFEDGTIYRSFNYANGKEEGTQKMWFEDGAVRANYVIRNGRRYGLMGSKPCG